MSRETHRKSEPDERVEQCIGMLKGGLHTRQLGVIELSRHGDNPIVPGILSEALRKEPDLGVRLLITKALKSFKTTERAVGEDPKEEQTNLTQDLAL